ncbi:MAG: 50S ribosomal protein L13 [Patescibacteria group bacterium]
MEITKREAHIIDATDKPLGRLAVEVSVLLRGKNKPNFEAYKEMGDIVIVKNADKIRYTGNKLENKNYFRFTGYLGNLKKTTLKELLIKRGPKEVLRKAVMGMMPKNKLRAIQIKRLKFE